MMLKLLLLLHTWLHKAHAQLCKAQTHKAQRGQATAEYALVLLGAAAVAMLLVSWVTGTNRISNLLDAVFRHITGLIG
ncbi:MAG: DUF4244 domain-containing protein [bacterium]|nr:DUF4244 domain-containing protein [bacterium]MCY4257544.1 DUF4244 domain-containing protein [bacterium]